MGCSLGKLCNFIFIYFYFYSIYYKMSVHNRLYVKTELFTNRVDGTDLTTADWAFLGTVDQNLAKADEVEFKSATLNNATATTKIQTAATGNYTLTLPVDDGLNGDVLKTDGAGVLSWDSTGGFDQDLNTTDNVQFVDLILTGDLTVSGTTTLVNTTDTEIKDNIITLNAGEAGAGVGTGLSGIEIDRGSLTTVQLLFDETTDKWTVGTSGAIGTTRYIVAEIADASQTQGAIPGYDSTGKLSEAEGLTTAEVNQLQNIDTETITTANWGHLASTDQDLATTNNVTFNDVTVNGTLSLSAPIATTVATLSAAATISSGITIYDTTAGVIPMIATLPDNATAIGVCYTVYLKTFVNNLVVTAAGGDTIEGVSSVTLDTVGQHLKLCSMGDGTWIIM
jgi:hypothetical protein